MSHLIRFLQTRNNQLAGVLPNGKCTFSDEVKTLQIMTLGDSLRLRVSVYSPEL